MEKQKLRYLQAFLGRTKLSLENCIRVIKEWEERARNCYAENIELGSDEFVKMILVDGSFIIEVIWRYDLLVPKNNIDYLSKPCAIIDDVRTDMILIENQLPFFVLEGLFNLAFPSHLDSSRASFIELSIQYFTDVLLTNNIPQIISNSEVNHFVDLFRLCHLPSSLRSLQAESVEFVAIRTATELEEVGLHFKRGSSNRLLDIHYAREALEIPQLCVHDRSESVLRNLIALEQCHYPFDSYITDYSTFMDTLIDTAKDVDLLIQSGIIDNNLGDSSIVATLFNNLTVEVVLWSPKYYFHGVSKS